MNDALVVAARGEGATPRAFDLSLLAEGEVTLRLDWSSLT